MSDPQGTFPSSQGDPSQPVRPPPLSYGQAPYGQPPYVPQYASAMIAPYASARPRALVVIGLMWAIVGLQVLMIAPQAMEIHHLGERMAGRADADELTAANIAHIGLGLIFLVVTLVAIVFWMMWVHRTYRNLPSLGAYGLRYSPGWAVGYYFIPILNLFRPLQVMGETWRASDPRHGGGTDWMRLSAPALLGWWWAFHLISTFLNQLSLRVGMRTESEEVLYAVAWLDLGLLGWDVAVALMEIHIVKGLTGLQDQRAAAYAAAPVAAFAPYPQHAPAGQP